MKRSSSPTQTRVLSARCSRKARRRSSSRSPERDNWAQLYLYDLNTGKLINKITTGDGPVTQIAHVDEKGRSLIVGALGRNPSEDPYFKHYYRVVLDGKGWKELTPESGDHTIQVSSDGRYF